MYFCTAYVSQKPITASCWKQLKKKQEEKRQPESRRNQDFWLGGAQTTNHMP